MYRLPGFLLAPSAGERHTDFGGLSRMSSTAGVHADLVQPASISASARSAVTVSLRPAPTLAPVTPARRLASPADRRFQSARRL